MSETPGTLNYDPHAAQTPIYRQSNMGAFRLSLAEAHWQSPQLRGRWCVQPGDVLLSKFPPVRAALVSSAARRHPVDGNTLILRGLAWREAVWVALCLNRPEYEALLLAGSALLRRVNLGVLAGLRVPPVPVGMEVLAARLGELLDELHSTGEKLYWLKLEVSEMVGQPPRPQGLHRGLFVESEVVSAESWLPATAALRSGQLALAEELGWVPIRVLGTMETRDRLVSAPEGARAVRLGDVSDDLYVRTAGEEAFGGELPYTRLLGNPLATGEVLLSTLGTSFRVAYVDERVPPQLFPIDGWVRIRFRETPAAWALLLASQRVNWQTAGLAIGTVQQFIPPAALLSLYVPVPEREMRARWQGALERHHARRRALDARWNDLMSALTTMFEAVHPPAPARGQAGRP